MISDLRRRDRPPIPTAPAVVADRMQSKLEGLFDHRVVAGLRQGRKKRKVSDSVAPHRQRFRIRTHSFAALAYEQRDSRCPQRCLFRPGGPGVKSRPL